MTSFKTSDFKIFTCECFCHQWKKIRETNDESWKFDEIENGKQTFRKLFADKKIIFHCCYSCMEKSIENYDNICYRRGGKIGDICNGCIRFLILKNENDFFIF